MESVTHNYWILTQQLFGFLCVIIDTASAVQMDV